MARPRALVACCRCRRVLDSVVALLESAGRAIRCPGCGTRQAVTESQWRRVRASAQPQLPGVL